MISERSTTRKKGRKYSLAVEAIESRNLLNGSPLLGHIASAIDAGAHTVETQTRHIITTIDHSTKSLIDHHAQHPAGAHTVDLGGHGDHRHIPPAHPHHDAHQVVNNAEPHHHRTVVGGRRHA